MSRGAVGAEELKELGERIERWRANRRGREMPAELWESAAALAQRWGVSHVATALGLGYGPLKQRAARAQPGLAAKRAGFVEVSGAQLLTSSASDTVRIEVARGEVRVVITLPAARGLLDVAALVNGVLRP